MFSYYLTKKELSNASNILHFFMEFYVLSMSNLHLAPGGGGLKKKLRSQLVRQNLKGALSCGRYQWKLYPFHTVFVDFQTSNTHTKIKIKKKIPIPHILL